MFQKTDPAHIDSISGLGASFHETPVIDVRDAVAGELDIAMSFSSPPAGGWVGVYLLSGPNGSDFDDDGIHVGTFYPADSTFRAVVPVNLLAERYIKFRIQNATQETLDAELYFSKTLV